jgi:hypothetical protein
MAQAGCHFQVGCMVCAPPLLATALQLLKLAMQHANGLGHAWLFLLLVMAVAVGGAHHCRLCRQSCS